MPVKVRCSGCEKVLNAPDKFRGKTVKCPKCKSPIKVPAPQKKKKTEPDPFSDDFLADLDLSSAEDTSQRVCPRCGASVGDEDIDCRACGASLLAGEAIAGSGGGRSPVGRKKKKGPNKSQFFQNTWGDAWAFTRKNMGYVYKTSFLVLILNLLYWCFVFMYNWCINPPPKAFWALLLFVFYMAPIGWVWHLVTETIKVSIAKKDKLKRVNFDFFSCVAFGIKFFAWTMIGGLPFVILLGVPGLLLMFNGAVIPGAVLVVASALMTYSLLPVAMTHMAMPQQLPGWKPQIVLPGWAKSLAPISYWMLILLITSLPVNACFVAIGATSGQKVAAFQRTMQSNAEILLERQKAEEDDGGNVAGDDREPQDLPWNNLLVPGILMCVGYLLSGPVVVFNARVIGRIAYYYGQEMDLNTLEKQVVYKAKPKPGDEDFKKINREGLSTVATGLNLMLTAIGITVLCQLASIAINICMAMGLFEPPLIVFAILGFTILGCGGLFLIGVLMGFAAPPEAKARGFLAMSFACPVIAIMLGVLLAAGVVSLDQVKGLAVVAVLVVVALAMSFVLTFVFFIMFLKRLSEYLYYYVGVEMADSIMFLYVAVIGLGFLSGMILGGSVAMGMAFLGFIIYAILAFISLGIEIAILKNLIELLSGLKDECRKPV